MSLLYCLHFTLSSFSLIQAYKLDKKLDAYNFLNPFDFISTRDKYTSGCASYVAKDEAVSMGLGRTIGNQIYIDVRPQGGRKSLHLESRDTIDSGIVIADFEHFPASILHVIFCGDYAGDQIWGDYTLCHTSTGVTSCNDYVAKTPFALDDMYLLINSVKTYNK